MFFDQDQISGPLEGDLSLTVAQKQKFTIGEISPERGYTTEATRLSLLDPFSVIRQNHHGYVCLVTLKFLFRSFRMVSSVAKCLLVLLEKSHCASLLAIGSLAVKLKSSIIEY